jgi:hypothetical protein
VLKGILQEAGIMGYILPINNEQSAQYTNRIIRKDGPPFVVKPVEKITIRAKLKGKTNYEDQYEEAKDRKELTEHNGSDITGKGKHFNETV